MLTGLGLGTLDYSICLITKKKFPSKMAHRQFIIFGLLLLTTNFSFSFGVTLIPRTTLPNPIELCAPNLIPNIELPTDYLTCSEQVAASRDQRHPDQDKTTGEVITQYGYNLEVHNVTTNDSYILTVHRITGGPASPPAPGKPSVYINHGMLLSSEFWILMYRDNSLAFKLADAGFDVWLGNARGSSYSLGHETLNSETDAEYWDFSWHEMAVSDVPAVVDRLLSVSGNEKISYIGHSMGTTQYFVGLSLIPELNNKIEKGLLLAPVAFLGHANNPFRYIAPLAIPPVEDLVSPVIRGRVDWFTQLQKIANFSIGDICTPTAIRCGVCDDALYFLFGFDAPQQNYTNIPNILSKFPDNVSLRTLVHYAQSMATCQFRQYDYGTVANLKKYGSLSPPAYDLTQITVPTYLFYGDADNYAAPEDVEITRSNLRPETVKEVYRVDWDLFNHMDFLYAKDANIMLYNKMLDVLQTPSD